MVSRLFKLHGNKEESFEAAFKLSVIEDAEKTTYQAGSPALLGDTQAKNVSNLLTVNGRLLICPILDWPQPTLTI